MRLTKDITAVERAQQIMDETDLDEGEYPNERRAARAALAFLPAYDDSDAETGLLDALADIMHLCDVAGWDFSELCKASRKHYAFEAVNFNGVAEDEQFRMALTER